MPIPRYITIPADTLTIQIVNAQVPDDHDLIIEIGQHVDVINRTKKEAFIVDLLAFAEYAQGKKHTSREMGLIFNLAAKAMSVGATMLRLYW